MQDIETKVIRAEACAKAAASSSGRFTPDLIQATRGEKCCSCEMCGPRCHCSLTRIFLHRMGSTDFDPELQSKPDWGNCAKIRMKTSNQLLNLEASSWCVTPTQFQRSSYPEAWRNRMSVIHDGIDTDKACPNKNPKAVILADGTVLRPGEKIVTFVNRRLEPYRGCHTMIRAIPHLQQLIPDAKLVIVEYNCELRRSCSKVNGRMFFWRRSKANMTQAVCISLARCPMSNSFRSCSSPKLMYISHIPL